MRGIYKITNKINGKVYIGESLNILRRWKEHKELLENNKHHNDKLQKEYNKYGIENFEFSIVSVLNEDILNFCDKYILLIYEYLYILKYNSIKNGYNIEMTATKVINGDKIVNREYDKNILKNYKNKIDEGIIKESGGIIFYDYYSLSHIENKLNIDRKKVKEALRYHGILITIDGKMQLNENKLTGGIEVNGSYTKVKIDSKLYEYLVSLVEDYLKNESKYVKPKEIKNKQIKKVEVVAGEFNINDYVLVSEEFTYNTFKDFLGGYKLKLTYNNVFKYLRENNIIEYKLIDNNKFNVPCKQYTNIIHIKFYQTQNEGKNFVKMFLTKEGELFFNKLLMDNDLID